ncbi:stress-responsive transcription factor hsf1 [Mactra antiquata]
MLSSYEMGVNNVPAFLTKLWYLVEDSATDELIAWDASGLSFHLYDQVRFAKEILPLYFKHSNIASFIRQLNMYGFRKVVHLDSNAIKSEVDDVEFHHPSFVRGQEQLLEYIKRKSSTGAVVGVKSDPPLKLKEEDVNRVLTDVQLMKGKQDSLSTKMDKMKKENEALWREVASLRQKHLKQQQIVNKLIQFMVHLVGGNPGMPGSSLSKRKMPLMINDSSQVSSAKRPKYSKQLSIEELDDPSNYVVKSVGSSSVTSDNLMGPVIEEVIESPTSLSSPVTLETHNYSKPVSKTVSSSSITPVNLPGFRTSTNIANPGSSSQNMTLEKVSLSKNSDLFGESLNSTDLSNLLQIEDTSTLPLTNEESSSNSNVLDKYMKDHPIQDRQNYYPTSPLELSGHLDSLQDDINGLKDILGGQYNFDPSTLISLFSSENSVPVTVENLLGDLDATAGASNLPIDANPNSITGNELVQFHPAENFLSTITDLNDIIDNTNNTENSKVINTQSTSNANSSVAIPLFTEEAEETVDPMSFINTGNTSDETPSFDPDLELSLDTPHTLLQEPHT